MLLTWTVASAVFGALDIVATFLYDVESPASYFSAGFSFLSVWYGLFQRKRDLAVLAQIGTKKINLASTTRQAKRQYRRVKEAVLAGFGTDAAVKAQTDAAAKAAGEGTVASPKVVAQADVANPVLGADEQTQTAALLQRQPSTESATV